MFNLWVVLEVIVIARKCCTFAVFLKEVVDDRRFLGVICILVNLIKLCVN